MMWTGKDLPVLLVDFQMLFMTVALQLTMPQARESSVDSVAPSLPVVLFSPGPLPSNMSILSLLSVFLEILPVEKLASDYRLIPV